MLQASIPSPIASGWFYRRAGRLDRRHAGPLRYLVPADLIDASVKTASSGTE